MSCPCYEQFFDPLQRLPLKYSAENFTDSEDGVSLTASRRTNCYSQEQQFYALHYDNLLQIFCWSSFFIVNEKLCENCLWLYRLQTLAIVFVIFTLISWQSLKLQITLYNYTIYKVASSTHKETVFANVDFKKCAKKMTQHVEFWVWDVISSI